MRLWARRASTALKSWQLAAGLCDAYDVNLQLMSEVDQQLAALACFTLCSCEGMSYLLCHPGDDTICFACIQQPAIHSSATECPVANATVP